MNKYRFLAKNIGLLTLSNLGTKLLTFFLVPLYTNVLTTAEYGTYDLFNTTIGVLVPIVTLNIMEAVLRFSLEENNNRERIFTIGIKFLGIGSAIVLVCLWLNHIFEVVEIIDDYAFFFFLMFFVQALSGVCMGFARGLDKIEDVSIAGIFGSIVMLMLNILLLATFNLGLKGYFVAHIVGVGVQSAYLIIKLKCWEYISKKPSGDTSQQDMITYSCPLIANSVAWWVNNLADRYIVIFFCGLSANGIYSVAAKIPSILSIFQTIFNQAWTLSAVHDYDADDKSGFFQKMYHLYNASMCIICSGLILFNRVLAKLLYAKDFYSAWKYMPFLMISIVFGAMSGYIGGIFSAVKDSKIFAKSTVLGAIVNVCMNFILVPLVGPIGAAIATTISYWFVWVIRVKHLKKYLSISINIKRDYLTYILLVIQSMAFLFFMEENLALYFIEVILLLLIIFCYKSELVSVIKCFFDINKLKVK